MERKTIPKAMPEDHPDPELLERFMRSEADAEGRRGIVRHLLAGCSRCLRLTRRLWQLGEGRMEEPPDAGGPGLPPAAYGEVLAAPAALGPRRGAITFHGLALRLAESGRAEDALRAIAKARPLYEQSGDVPNLARLRHLEGRIEEARGAPRAAEAAFLAARQGFLARGLGAEAAAVLLDLALCYQLDGRAPEVRRLAGELFPILRARDIRQGVAAALLFFRALVESGQVTPEGLFAVAGYLGGPKRVGR